MPGTVALTGATGFIGATLVRQLAAAGWRVRALVRPASLGRCPAEVEAEWLAGDLADIDSLHRLTRGVTAVVHCAGVVRGASRADFDRINVDGTARLVRAATAGPDPPRFLLVSSLAARAPELSFYAASKRGGEAQLAALAGTMDWGIVRPAAVYGPGDREMLPLFQSMVRGLAPVIGAATNRVSLVHVEDLAAALLAWLVRGRASAVYEVGDGRPNGYSWREIIAIAEQLRGGRIVRLPLPVPLVRLIARLNLTLARLTGRAPMLSPGKVRELTYPDWVADNTSLHTDTGWTARIGLAEGLRRTLNLAA